MTETLVTRTHQGHVAVLTLNQPATLNALSVAMITALTDALHELAATDTVRVVILRAEGKAFCAGHDLREMQNARTQPDQGRAWFEQLFHQCAELMQTIVSLPQPVIAEVQGIATAAGCQLVASCDLAVASSQARFGVNGVNIGLFCSTPMVALSRNIARKQAFELLTTGDFVNAERAQVLGLINRVTGADKLSEATLALAEQIAGKLGAAVRIGKRTFYEQLEMPLSAAYAHAGTAMVENMLWQDTAEGIDAFLGKRVPSWQDD